MEDKNLPKSDIYDLNNEDEYYPLEETSDDVSDDDLDLSELLRKYMPEEAERRNAIVEEEAADLANVFTMEEDTAEESFDASVYSEFASEIYSEDDAANAAAADAQYYSDEVPAEDYAAEDYAAEDYAPAEEYAAEDYTSEDYAAEEYVTEDYASEDYAPAEEYVAEDYTAEEYAPSDDYAAEDYAVGDYAESYTADGYYGEDADASLEAASDEVYTGEYDPEEYTEYAEGDAYADYSAEGEYAEAYDYDEAYTDENAEYADYEEYPAEAVYDEEVEVSEESEEATPDFINYEEQEEQLDIDENIDSTDINLMLAFGLDDELERTMGVDVAKKLTAELDEEQRKRDEKVRKTVDNEYMNRTQTAGFAKEYKTKYFAVKIKLALSAIFAIVLFFYENLRIFGYEFDGAFDGAVYPTVYIMVSLQLLLLCVACAGTELLEGLKNLFIGKIEPRSVTAVLVITAIAYSIVQTGTVRVAESPTLLNFAVALTVVFTLVAEYFNIRREIFAFNIVSSKRPKHIITKVLPAYDEPAPADDGDILKFESASFIDGFFTRTKEPTHASKSYAVASLVIALVSGLIAGFFTKFTGSVVPVCVENAFTAFFIAVPASMLITMSYPFYRASRDAYDNDGAIIGECSLEEYSDASCVTFDDVGVFPSYGVRVQNVKIYNNHRIDRVLFYASSAFSVARGPLTDVFDVATMEIGHSDNVRIKAAGSGYLAVTVDDKNITFGSAAELVSRGYWIPESVTDEDAYNEDDVSVMYMFREEKLMAKMLIKYTLDTDFEAIMSSLCDEGISVSIKTYDPNIDDDLIGAGLLKRSEYSYSVTRYDGADDGNTIKDTADSGIVSRGSAKTLLQMLSDCTKVLASRRAGITIGIISAIVSVLLMLIVILSGRGDSLTSAVIAVYQLFWMIPTFICARMYVR